MALTLYTLPSQARIAIRAINWTQAELAKRLGVYPETVCNWFKSTLPVYAAEYIRLAVELDNIQKAIGPLLKPIREDGRKNNRLSAPHAHARKPPVS